MKAAKIDYYNSAVTHAQRKHEVRVKICRETTNENSNLLSKIQRLYLIELAAIRIRVRSL